MSTLKELNGRLSGQPYVTGFSPSKEDARIFEEMFGQNANAFQWAARMASYYQQERDQLLNGVKANDNAKAKPAAEEDEDFDLFGGDDAADKALLDAKKEKEKSEKKAKKVVIAKSSILYDVKPFDDTTDLEELAAKIKAVERDGLLWGQHKLVEIAFGLKKLQILLVIEDDKVTSEDLEDIFESFEDEVQSVDVVAWNKI